MWKTIIQHSIQLNSKRNNRIWNCETKRPQDDKQVRQESVNNIIKIMIRMVESTTTTSLFLQPEK